jgi:MFS transporter, AAHS family, 3-hydroxyphenylpropionic acid transporter
VSGRVRAGAGLTVLLCFLIAAIEGYDIQAFGIAAPRIAQEMGLGPSQLGWAGSAAMIGLVIGAFAGGWLADRLGRRPVLAGSVATFGLFSIATALSDSYALLLGARLLAGLGFGGAMPNLIAIAVEISPLRRRSVTVAAVFCGMPAGGAASALLARLAGEALDWRLIFWAGGLIPLLLAPVVLALLPETRPAVDPRADRRNLRALFGQRRAAPTLLLWSAFVLTLLILYLVLNWLPTLVVAKGLPPADGFAAAMSFNLAGVVGALTLGWCADRLGYRWPVVLACAGLAACMMGLAASAESFPMLALSGLAGFLVLGAQYALYAAAPALYPAEVRAWGAGAAVAVGRFGSIAGPLVAGELRQAGATAGEVFAAMAPVAVAAGAAVLMLGFTSASKRADP